MVNDIEIITSQVIKGAKAYTDTNYAGDGFRPDDHGNDIAHATRMTFEPDTGTWTGTGIIEGGKLKAQARNDGGLSDWEGGVTLVAEVPLESGRFVTIDDIGDAASAVMTATSAPPKAL